METQITLNKEEARRLSDLLLDGYKKCDYTKQLLSIQDIMQCAFKAGYKTLKVELTNGTYQKIEVKKNKYLARCWGAYYRQNNNSIFYNADIKLDEVKRIIYRNMILWEVK